MAELLVPQLVTAAVLLAVIVLSARRVIAQSNEAHLQRMADYDAYSSKLIADARAQLEATLMAMPPPPPPAYLELTLTVNGRGNADALAKKVENLIDKLSGLEAALGGAGVTRDPERSKAEPGTVTLVLVPNNPAGAEFRLDKLAEVATAAIEVGGVPVHAEVKRMAA